MSTTLRLGKPFPNLYVKTTEGEFNLHEWKGSSWMMFFSHPRDFTPVCTTEISSLAEKASEFKKRDVKLIGLSCDSVDSHKSWESDVLEYAKVVHGCHMNKLPFPLIEDTDRKLAKLFGMIDEEESLEVGMPLTCRAVFIVSPENILKLFLYYPATTGRNIDELIRAIDSLQLTANAKIATPANWNPGDKVMITPSANENEAKQIDPNHKLMNVPSEKAYLRLADLKQ